MILKIDTREDESIKQILQELGCDYEIATLPAGDFILEEKGIVIERKTVADFVGSIMSGHLQKQLLQMEQFDHPFLIISGSMKDLTHSPKWTENHHIGSLVSCLVRYETKILIVDNDEQLVKAVIKICQKVDDGKAVNINDTELMRNSFTREDMRLKLLNCFDGIGIIRGQKLLEQYSELKEKINEIVEYIDNKLYKT